MENNNFDGIEVIGYLKALRKFLYGDLANFKKFSEQAERIEDSDAKIFGTIEGNKGTSGQAGNPKYYLTESNQSTKSEIPIIPQNKQLTGTSGDNMSPVIEKDNFDYKRDPQTNEFFRSTIPNTLALFATIDVVGFLLGNKKVPTGNGKENMKNFFSLNEDLINLDENDYSVLITLYRNGMSHAFFPKNEIGVSYYSQNPRKELFFLETSNGNITLNVNYLIELTQNILDYVIDNTDLYKNLQDQFPKLKEYNNLADLNISEFKGKLKKRDVIISHQY